jgi:magnesium-transporting ATPase (P-type)
MGLLGIVDPPRPEAIDAVREAQRAGIIVKMITGDHPSTALAISDRLGLRTTEGVVTGAQLDVLLRDANTAELDKTVLRTDVFARTTPEHKLRIVESLRRQHIVCSMTGDGVNDAPALKAANIGVAMGITGTEVAKEAANMIITDDNFATIVDAIRIGRTTYGNLIKIITFVLSVNGGQAFSVLGALVIGVDVPITALQILWVNMLISVSLGIELAFDKSEAHIMTQRPRHVDKRIFGRLLRWRVGFASLLFVCVVLGIYHWEQQRKGYDVVYLRTCSVNAMVISQAMYIFNCHDLRRNVSLSKMFLENWLIYVGLLLVGIFQAVLTYTRPFQLVFEVTAIDGVSWGKILLLSMALFLVVEVEKAVSAQIARLRRG